MPSAAFRAGYNLGHASLPLGETRESFLEFGGELAGPIAHIELQSPHGQIEHLLLLLKLIFDLFGGLIERRQARKLAERFAMSVEFAAEAFDEARIKCIETEVLIPLPGMLGNKGRLLRSAFIDDGPKVFGALVPLEIQVANRSRRFAISGDLHLFEGGGELEIAFAMCLKTPEVFKHRPQDAICLLQGEILDGVTNAGNSFGIKEVNTIFS